MKYGIAHIEITAVFLYIRPTSLFTISYLIQVFIILIQYYKVDKLELLIWYELKFNWENVTAEINATLERRRISLLDFLELRNPSVVRTDDLLQCFLKLFLLVPTNISDCFCVASIKCCPSVKQYLYSCMITVQISVMCYYWTPTCLLWTLIQSKPLKYKVLLGTVCTQCRCVYLILWTVYIYHSSKDKQSKWDTVLFLCIVFSDVIT